MKKQILAALLVVVSCLAHADPKLSYDGYVDVNASFNTTTTDSLLNGLHLGTAHLTVKSDNEGPNNGALIQLIYGENALAFTSLNAGSSTSNIKQAHLYQSFGKFTVQAGKFIGFLGYELPDPNSNFNYTRSALFFAEPVYNVGVVGKYAINDVTNLIAYGVNENSSDASLDETKDAGASLQSLGATKGLAINWYRDNSKTLGVFDHRDLLNAYSYIMLGNVTLAGEYLHSDMYFNAGAGYMSVSSGDTSASLRGVYVSNPGTLVGDTSSQYTMTLKHKNGNIVNAIEIVMDSSPVGIYYNTASGTSQNNQTTLLLSSVYSF